MARPKCHICSYRQPEPLPCVSVYHLHYSSREIRYMQGVEGSTTNRSYMCPTCERSHESTPRYGLNVCLGDSQLHDFHWPKEPGVTCPPDSLHVDWVTIPGATLPTLHMDYYKSKQPMNIILVTGVNDLIRGGSMHPLITSILKMIPKLIYKQVSSYFHL